MNTWTTMKSTVMTKTESFDKLIAKKFTKDEIAKMKRHAQLEAAYLQQFQRIISNSLEEYIKKNNATIEDIAQEAGWSKYKISKIKSGEYNFTIPDVSYLLATLNVEPKEVFNLKN